MHLRSSNWQLAQTNVKRWAYIYEEERKNKLRNLTLFLKLSSINLARWKRDTYSSLKSKKNLDIKKRKRNSTFGWKFIYEKKMNY